MIDANYRVSRSSPSRVQGNEMNEELEGPLHRQNDRRTRARTVDLGEPGK
jgi:hypothetical protein